jgi:hypothetical protein
MTSYVTSNTGAYIGGIAKGDTKMQTTTPTQGWHTAQWGTWGWLETIAKLVAIIAGFLALINRVPGNFMLGGNPHLAAVIILGVLTALSVVQVVIRLGQREAISMAFAVLNLLGHIALLISIVQVPHHRLWPVLFGAFYVVGQLIKIQFLRISGYTEGGADTAGMVRVAGAMALLYALFTVFMLPG